MSILDRFRNKRTGDAGERTARDYLKRLGWRVLETNYRSPSGEVDVIAWDGEEIVFVEVKTRTSGTVPPEDAVDEAKLRRIAAAGESYVETKRLYRHPWRIDVVAVEGGPDGLRVTRHLKGL